MNLMNPYIKNLNRLEFFITYACTGKCKHCSEGEHTKAGKHLDGELAANIVRKVCGKFNIESLMTFGGEALLYPDVVCKIHMAAMEMNIPKRQLITNGFFTNDRDKIKQVVRNITESGINDICLSVDAFHQETIPLEPVKFFAESVKSEGVRLHTHPAWLVHENDENPYNIKTKKILEEFERTGIESSSGNIIFPSGNARKYLEKYFDSSNVPENPYEEDPKDVRAISISPNGEVLNGNVYQTDILDILLKYTP